MELTELVVLVLSFLLLAGMGVPVAFCIGLSTLLTMLVAMDVLPAITTEAQRIATGLDSFALLAIPFFILAGQIMNRGGIARRLIDLARALMGTLPGGLAHINIVAAMLFGAISGSAAAAATAVGGTVGPRMKEAGYDTGFAVAANVTSSTTGLIIPPSNSLIIYSLASGGVSIGALFLAGYGPGFLVGLFLMITAGIIAARRGYPTAERAGLGEIARRFLDATPGLLLLVIVMGGIVGGIFTATEAAAVAVLYALLLSLAYREITLRQIPEILVESVVTNAVVMMLIATSMGLSWILAYIQLPQALTAALVGAEASPWVILFLMNLILLLVGMFMDLTPAVLIFTPIMLPVAVELGIDPVHFGIIMVLNLSIGLCSPPVGSLLFIGVSVGETSITRVVPMLIPFFVAMLLALAVVTAAPALSLWLPAQFGF